MIKAIITTLFSPIVAVWQYFKDMNSERGAGVSIKRNIAWGVGTLMVFVQVYALMKLPRVEHNDILAYIVLVKFLAVLDASLILLVLGITSVEKITDLVQRIRNNVPLKEAAVQAPPTDNKA